MIRQFLGHGSNMALIALCLLLLACDGAGLLRLFWPAILLGAALFYATEYGTHRFLFHARPSRFAWLRAKQHRLHYDHHLEPARLDLLFLPLWYVLPQLLLTTLLGRAMLGTWGSAAALDFGAMLALLHYEWVHYIAHIPYRPRSSAGRWMKKYHLRHHFKNEKLWFGVSNPAADYLSGTFRDPDQAARSKTTKVLFPSE